MTLKSFIYRKSCGFTNYSWVSAHALRQGCSSCMNGARSGCWFIESQRIGARARVYMCKITSNVLHKTTECLQSVQFSGVFCFVFANQWNTLCTCTRLLEPDHAARIGQTLILAQVGLSPSCTTVHTETESLLGLAHTLMWKSHLEHSTVELQLIYQFWLQLDIVA